MGKWLKSTELIRFDVKDRIARITLNRPEKRNSLNAALLRELHDALLEADDRADVNVIILDGAGKDFCAGYDLVTSYSDRQGRRCGRQPVEEVTYRTVSGTVDDDCWQLEVYAAPHDRVVRSAQAGDCESARQLPRRRHGSRVHVRHGHCGGRREDRLSRDARQRHAANAHVGLSPGTAMGEAPVDDGRLSVGPRCGEASDSCSTQCPSTVSMKRSTSSRGA